MLLPWWLPKSIKQFILLKGNKEAWAGSALTLHLSVSVYQPLEKPLIHTDPLLICPADAATTTKTFVPSWQHDHSCFRLWGLPQGWSGASELSSLQRKIKWNMMTSQAGAGFWRVLQVFPHQNSVHLLWPGAVLVFRRCLINIVYHHWGCRLNPLPIIKC